MSAYSTEQTQETRTPDPAGDDYGFLVGRLIDRATLERASDLAGDWDVDVADVLIANGWVHPSDYSRALAETCDVDFIEPDQAVMLAPADENSSAQECLASGLLRHSLFGEQRAALAQPSIAPSRLRQHLSALGTGRARLALTTQQDLRRTIRGYFSHQLIDHATHDLSRRFPGESAVALFAGGQHRVLFLLAALVAVAAAFEPLVTLRTVAGLGALYFLLVAGLPILAIAAILYRRLERGTHTTYRLHDSILPVYTILVPLFREQDVLPDLARALRRLDYPPAKLDIKLVFESVDHDTLEIAKALEFPGNVEFIVVPDSVPRTKPKALNYALAFARGDYVVVYDAEDRPEPDQLRKAMLAFQEGPETLACVQARLNVYNGNQNWLTRQFAVEYSVLYDALLPALRLLRIPIPLGGTSSHFRIPVLKQLGGWDAFNVAQNVDLGIRLARRGYECQILDSTTLEEAACGLGAWMRQRTRWLKGTMQTYLVHMRRPRALWRELGARGFLGFQVVIGGLTVAGLALPVVCAMAAAEVFASAWPYLPSPLFGEFFWVLAIFTFCVGYVSSMVSGFLTVGSGLARHVILLPVYWILISLAAYRALFQVVSAPHHWEKTEHGVSDVPNAFEPRISA